MSTVERLAQAIPPHSFISEDAWDDCNEVQRNRRRDLARHLVRVQNDETPAEARVSDAQGA